MRIVFFGNGNFAINPLKTLLSSKHNVLKIVTDKPKRIKNRGSKNILTPVSSFANKHSLDILYFEDLKSKNSLKELKDLSPDVFVVVEFKLLSKNIFTIPLNGFEPCVSYLKRSKKTISSLISIFLEVIWFSSFSS